MQETPKFTRFYWGATLTFTDGTSFYKLYHQPVKAIASIQLAPTRYTKIVDLELIPGFAEDPIWIDSMRKIKNVPWPQEPVILITVVTVMLNWLPSTRMNFLMCSFAHISTTICWSTWTTRNASMKSVQSTSCRIPQLGRSRYLTRIRTKLSSRLTIQLPWSQLTVWNGSTYFEGRKSLPDPIPRRIRQGAECSLF